MEKIILRRVKKPIPNNGKVIKVDEEIYDKLSSLSEDTSISVQRLSSLLLEIALNNTVVVDEGGYTDGNNN